VVSTLPAAVVARREVGSGSLALRGSWSTVAVCFGAATAAVTATIGPDARWLGALGRIVVERGAVPHGVPFAAAPSSSWPNVPVLAELVFRGLTGALGDRGLLLAQLAAVGAGLVVTRREMGRLGATDAGAALALALLVPGALLAFAGIKAQLFSLALFPLVVGLLRHEAREPSRRIWLLPPLIALWSNLHGAALLGVAAAGAYLVLERARRRPGESVGVAALSLLALCATPALAQTPRYYHGVLTSVAAQRGYGLWAPLSLDKGFDLLLVGVGSALLAAFLRSRPRPWELAVAATLVWASIHTARNGVWLLLFVAAPAATAFRGRTTPHPAVVHALALLCLAAGALGVVRGPQAAGAEPRIVGRAIEAAHGRPILAEPASAEQIAAAGGRVWIANPLDAFAPADQRAYLEWLDGKAAGDRLLSLARTVVVTPGSPAAQRLGRDDRFRVTARSARTMVFVRA
jgi:hypothetical protein